MGDMRAELRISKEQVSAMLLGAATGDAFGVPFEFLSADEVAQYSLEVMRGADNSPVASHWGQTIPAGAWSDDTSMAVATMESVIGAGGELDATDVMNRFVAWWERGEYCAIERPFGLGKTVGLALGRFKAGRPASECGGTRVRDNGNGSLMRIFPIALMLSSKTVAPQERWELIGQASRLTHAHAISELSCIIYCEFLGFILAGSSIEETYQSAAALPYQDWRAGDDWQAALDAHQRILGSNFMGLSASDLRASGYVVDTLEIVLYSLLHTNTYREAVQAAVRFGYDTDTYAAIAGAAAGAAYGLKEIPQDWLSKLKRHEYLEGLAGRFTRTIK